MNQFQPDNNPHYIISWARNDDGVNIPSVSFSDMGESKLATIIRTYYTTLETSHNELFDYFKEKVEGYEICRSVLDNTFLLHKWNIQLEYFPFSKSEIYNDMCTFTDDEIIERLTDHIVVINTTIDEYALEQELRNMLHPGRIRNSLSAGGVTGSSVSYSMSGPDTEMEFVKEIKKQKHPTYIEFGGGKLLPPINPTDPSIIDLPNTLNTKKQKDPTAPKIEQEVIEIQYPSIKRDGRTSRRNKYVHDSDYKIKQHFFNKSTSSMILGKRSTKLRKGIVSRNISDLSFSIDQQMISMKQASDDLDLKFSNGHVPLKGRKVKSIQSNHSKSLDSFSTSMLSSSSDTFSKLNTSVLKNPPIRVPTGESSTIDSSHNTSVDEGQLALNSGRRNSSFYD